MKPRYKAYIACLTIAFSSFAGVVCSASADLTAKVEILAQSVEWSNAGTLPVVVFHFSNDGSGTAGVVLPPSQSATLTVSVTDTNGKTVAQYASDALQLSSLSTDGLEIGGDNSSDYFIAPYQPETVLTQGDYVVNISWRLPYTSNTATTPDWSSPSQNSPVLSGSGSIPLYVVATSNYTLPIVANQVAALLSDPKTSESLSNAFSNILFSIPSSISASAWATALASSNQLIREELMHRLASTDDKAAADILATYAFTSGLQPADTLEADRSLIAMYKAGPSDLHSYIATLYAQHGRSPNAETIPLNDD